MPSHFLLSFKICQIPCIVETVIYGPYDEANPRFAIKRTDVNLYFHPSPPGTRIPGTNRLRVLYPYWTRNPGPLVTVYRPPTVTNDSVSSPAVDTEEDQDEEEEEEEDQDEEEEEEEEENQDKEEEEEEENEDEDEDIDDVESEYIIENDRELNWKFQFHFRSKNYIEEISSALETHHLARGRKVEFGRDGLFYFVNDSM